MKKNNEEKEKEEVNLQVLITWNRKFKQSYGVVHSDTNHVSEVVYKQLTYLRSEHCP